MFYNKSIWQPNKIKPNVYTLPAVTDCRFGSWDCLYIFRSSLNNNVSVLYGYS